MSQPDFERAKRYALERLERELAPHFVYHSLAHTRGDVVVAAERFAALEGVAGESLLLLRTAAHYHDLGFVERHTEHEAASVAIAGRVLPGFGYTPAHIQVISGMIIATRLPQAPHNLLEQILADADLEIFGRQDFMDRNRALRAELAAMGRVMSDREWYAGQLAFMQKHRYWTSAAQRLHVVRKQENIAAMARLLVQSQAQSSATRETAG